MGAIATEEIWLDNLDWKTFSIPSLMTRTSWFHATSEMIVHKFYQHWMYKKHTGDRNLRSQSECQVNNIRMPKDFYHPKEPAGHGEKGAYTTRSLKIPRLPCHCFGFSRQQRRGALLLLSFLFAPLRFYIYKQANDLCIQYRRLSLRRG